MIPDEHQRGNGLKENADGDNQIPDIPAATGLVGVNPARHAENSRHVHEVERQMEADDEQPELKLAEFLVVHSAGHFREPIIESAENRKENRAYDHVMEVRNHKVRAAELPVEWSGGKHDPGKSGNQELEDERNAEQHGRLEL